MNAFLNVLLLISTSVFPTDAWRYVRRYEYLQYAARPVSGQAERRSERSSQPLAIDFRAFSREFRLRLTEDRSTFASDLVIVAPGRADSGPVPPPHLQLYRGVVESSPGSYAYGAVRDGVFEGVIELPPLVYYVEPARVVVSGPRDEDRRPADAHSVIYASTDVSHPHKLACGFNDSVTADYHHTNGSSRNSQRNQMSYESRDRRYISGRYIPVPGENPNKDQAKVCTMSVETDPRLWEYALEKSDGDDRKARDFLISLVGNHMMYVNRLYEGLSFNGKYPHEGLQFQLQKLLITDNRSCAARARHRSRFCSEHVDYDDFLRLQTSADHGEFCLAYAFTYRDFSDSVLGYAWKGDNGSADYHSGVCGASYYGEIPIQGKTVSSMISRNTGIVTLMSFQERVPTVTSHITFAHEIGHSLGSSHDPDDSVVCSPDGYGGKYIMHPYSVSGYDPNNSRFSPCSQREIAAVLDLIAEGRRRQCFQATTASFCGNRVKEEGEECDCGFTNDTCVDRCCYPRIIPDSEQELNKTARGCTRRANTECSTSDGACCVPGTCRLVAASAARVCQEETECRQAAACDGESAACPAPAHKPNMTDCRRGTKVCMDGLCQTSVCIKTKQVECMIRSNDTEDASQLCLVSCRAPPPAVSACAPLGPAPLARVPGAACHPAGAGAVGYCDVFGRCRPYRADGPLARLRRLLFTGQGRSDLLVWLQTYWWGAALIVVSVTGLLLVAIRCFAVHTPSSNPRRPPRRRFQETLKQPLEPLGLRNEQLRCWRVDAVAPAATGPGDADAWSESSSFEHVGQFDFPRPPTGVVRAPAV